MITIFNREEIATTFDLQKQAEIRQILQQNGIEYHVKVVNRHSPSPFAPGTRSRTGTMGENINLEYEYIFYVKKEDADQARYCVMQRLRNL